MEVQQDYTVSITTEHSKEQLLVERAKTDDAAFVELYNDYFPKIYGFVLKRTGQRETAEDIVSSVFMKVFTNLKSYSYRECSFGAWVYKIASNALIDHYRKVARHPETMPEEMPEIYDEKQDVDTGLMLREEQALVRAVLKKLPDRYEQILSLKFFAELSNQEIADSLDIKANNVGVLIHRALAKFEECYQLYVQKQ